MNFAAIQTFLTVVRLRNLNRAASELHVTQSAVTARLDALEQALGARLLNRSRKGATLTKAGYAFLEQAELITRTWDNARRKIAFPEGITRLFSLACDPALWMGNGREWLADLRAVHSETAFEVWTARQREAEEWMNSGMSDAALLADPVIGPDFDNRVLFHDWLVQVATVDRQVMCWDSGYVFVDYGPGFRVQHAEIWSGDERATVTFSNPEWALDHILSHGGSAFLPKRMVQAHLQTGRLFKVSGCPEFERKTVLSWRKICEDQFPWLRMLETEDRHSA